MIESENYQENVVQASNEDLLKAKVALLAKFRAMLTANKERLHALEDEFLNRDDVASLNHNISYEKAYTAELETQIREMAAKIYARTLDKKVHPAVSIRIEHKLVYDENEAWEYARRTNPHLLLLDKKKFEKLAIAVSDVTPIPFVTIEDEVKALIVGDLAAFRDDG